MPSVTIDASVLTAPPPDSSVDDVQQYIDGLLGWSQLVDHHPVGIYMSSQATAALYADRLYPLRNELKNLFAARGIVYADSNSIATVVNSLLQHTPSLETYSRISDILTEKVVIEPDVLGLLAGENLQFDLERCLTLISIVRQYCGDLLNNHFLILRRAPKPIIAVKAQVLLIEHDRDDLEELPIHPELFNGNVPVCVDFYALLRRLDETSVLAESKDIASLRFAIRTALLKSRWALGEKTEWDELPEFGIHDCFLETMIGACRKRSTLPRKILRTIVETLNKTNRMDEHALRTGPGGNDPQQRRGRDRAMRRDIDRTYHLHYWACDDSFVELATVSYPYSNYSIPK